jgi:two-component system cell cycle sensor histidine kinase/response regulator CckA
LQFSYLKQNRKRGSVCWVLALKVPAQEGEGGKSFSEMWTDRLRLHRRTILVVEPDPVTRQLLARSLRPAYHVLQAVSAEEAVRIAAQHRRNIELLLTEVRLPQMFGWELLELLELDYPKLKVVYVSKSIDHETRVHTRGQKVFVPKQPFGESCLRKTIREGLENPQSNRVEMKWTAPSFLSRMCSYFRRHLWAH